MTNNDNLAAMGYSSREIMEHREFEASQPRGSYFANALAFIVESMNENEIDWGMIESLEGADLLEWAEMYNFDEENYRKAVEAFEVAAEMKVGFDIG